MNLLLKLWGAKWWQQNDTTGKDLFSDLAQWASGGTSFRLEDEIGTNKQWKKLERARHASYTRGYYDGKKKFEVFHEVGHLRTFLPLLEDCYIHYITNVVLSDLLPKFKKLRALSLSAYNIIGLPKSIGGLRHLRYLNLSYTKIRSLPESTVSLFNLQILILKSCSCLVKLPSNFRNLINLRHLDIRFVNLIKEMPLGMKELKNLQTLSNFVVGKDSGYGIEDLKHLKFLHGELCISRLEYTTGSQDIKEAILNDIKDLEVLLLEWGSQLDGSRNEIVEENVLDMLQPHRNLKELLIKCYCGSRFTSWIGDPSFSNMVAILKAVSICEAFPCCHDRFLEIVSDSKMVVDWINGDGVGNIDLVNVIYDIRGLLQRMERISVVFAGRNTNSCADRLAKMGSNMEGDFMEWSFLG